jgi:hypothetical protein
MIIHTSATWRQMHDALPKGVAFDRIHESGSRTHHHKFTVRLTGSGYRVNTGNHGAGELLGATWDEWGLFLANVYDVDPEALCPVPGYRNRLQFHLLTAGRFTDRTMPADTHRRHQWTYDVATGAQSCTKCSATHRRAS